MKRINEWLHSLKVSRIVAVMLITFAFIGLTAFFNHDSLQAQATPQTDNHVESRDLELPDSNTVKNIQNKANDLGDRAERPIGETGLKNIKNIPESIPETFKDARAQFRQEKNSDRVLNKE